MRKQTSKPVALQQSGDDRGKAHENENEIKRSERREMAALERVETVG